MFSTKSHLDDTELSEKKRRIFEFLKSHSVGVLSTVTPGGEPHAAVIYFAINEDFEITFTTKTGTKKSDNIQHQNHVMLIAFETNSQTTVQIAGKAEEIKNTQEAGSAFHESERAAILTSETGIPPITKLYAGNYVAYRIKPIQIRMNVFMRPESGGYETFETLDF